MARVWSRIFLGFVGIILKKIEILPGQNDKEPGQRREDKLVRAGLDGAEFLL